jgi:hypothetical protein
MTTGIEALTQAMQEWANAIRGDWSDVDGRSVRVEIEEWISALNGGPESERTIERWRDSMGVCPKGEGHWLHHCEWIHADAAGVSR